MEADGGDVRIEVEIRETEKREYASFWRGGGGCKPKKAGGI